MIRLWNSKAPLHEYKHVKFRFGSLCMSLINYGQQFKELVKRQILSRKRYCQPHGQGFSLSAYCCHCQLDHELYLMFWEPMTGRKRWSRVEAFSAKRRLSTLLVIGSDVARRHPRHFAPPSATPSNAAPSPFRWAQGALRGGPGVGRQTGPSLVESTDLIRPSSPHPSPHPAQRPHLSGAPSGEQPHDFQLTLALGAVADVRPGQRSTPCCVIWFNPRQTARPSRGVPPGPCGDHPAGDHPVGAVDKHSHDGVFGAIVTRGDWTAS